MLIYTPALALMPEADVDHQRIAALLRSWRDQLGWSRAQVAAAAGLTLEPVKQMEKGAAHTLDNLVAVLPIYGKTLEDVLGGAVPAELLSALTGPVDGSVRMSVHAGAVGRYTRRIADLEGELAKARAGIDPVELGRVASEQTGGSGSRPRPAPDAQNTERNAAQRGSHTKKRRD